MTAVRPERDGDAGAIGALHAAAFGGDVVPRLVDLLRRRTAPDRLVSLVAEEGGRVAGHVMLSPIPLETAPGRLRDVACLSPLGVLPSQQGRGVGRRLVEAAVAQAERRGEPVVLLEGDPGMYARFGFEPAARYGLRRPSERTPAEAFQVRLLAAHDPALRGRVLYPAAFWELDAVGRPVGGPTWLDELERHARTIEDAVTGTRTAPPLPGAPAAAPLRTPPGGREAVLAAPVPACPGWTAGDVLRHLGVVHRVVAAWITAGRRPRPGTVPDGPPDGDVVGWFAVGWRTLQDLLDGIAPDTPVAGWCPWETSAGFWRRRQAHELAVHALDVLAAVGDEGAWRVPDEVATDGIDEALRLWLGTRAACAAPPGTGDVVRVVAGTATWTVGLHERLVEVHALPTPADGEVRGSPAAVYRWLWGRAGTGAAGSGGSAGAAGSADADSRPNVADVADAAVAGDADAVAALRAALAGAMR